MGFKEISLIIAVVVFVLYVAYVWGRFGIQKSISISYYEFPYIVLSVHLENDYTQNEHTRNTFLTALVALYSDTS